MTIEESITILNELKDNDIYGPAVCIAINALEKNIPKSPIGFTECGGYRAKCPTCGNLVYHCEWFKTTKEKYHRSVCLHCRQRFTAPTNRIGIWEGQDL